MNAPYKPDPYVDLVDQLVSKLLDPQLQPKALRPAAWIADLLTSGTPAHAQTAYWDDILEYVEQYRAVVSLCEKNNLPLMCVKTKIGNKLVPVLLDYATLKKVSWRFKIRRRSSAHKALVLENLILERASLRATVSPHSVAETMGFFTTWLTDLLSSRLRGSSTGDKDANGGHDMAGGSGGGSRRTYEFEVATRSKGLRVYWTPAAILFLGKVFGYPTTPVRGALPPGKYCFGAGPPSSKQKAAYEMGAYYDVPATDHAYLDL